MLSSKHLFAREPDRLEVVSPDGGRLVSRPAKGVDPSIRNGRFAVGCAACAKPIDPADPDNVVRRLGKTRLVWHGECRAAEKRSAG